MGFFDSFKLLNKKTGYVIKYKNSTLIVVKPLILKEIVLDNLSKKLITEISNQIIPSTTKRKTNTLAIKLLSCYNSMKKEYYENPRLRDITLKSKEYKYFIQASELLKIHKVKPKVFLNAQIAGLEFINNGEGTFPKPLQLATIGAEERLVKIIKTDASLNDPSKINRLELNKSDKEIELMKNPRFVSKYEKMRNKKANLQDAYFVYDCMMLRKGRVTKFVNNFINELENIEC